MNLQGPVSPLFTPSAITLASGTDVIHPAQGVASFRLDITCIRWHRDLVDDLYETSITPGLHTVAANGQNWCCHVMQSSIRTA